MSDMIERVAKAMCKSKSCEGFKCCQHPANMGRIRCPVEDGGFEDAARAAIGVMREPTQAMLDASWVNTRDVKPDDRMSALLMDTSMAHRVKTLNRWRAMIDAALSQATPHSLHPPKDTPAANPAPVDPSLQAPAHSTGEQP